MRIGFGNEKWRNCNNIDWLSYKLFHGHVWLSNEEKMKSFGNWKLEPENVQLFAPNQTSV